MKKIFNTKEEAIQEANFEAQCPKGTYVRDVKVIDLGIRNPDKKGKYALTRGSDTRVIYIARGVRV